MSNPKYYYGTELKWSTEDVELIAEGMDIRLTQEQMVQVLIATFEDNEYIGQMINEEIQKTIEYIQESEQSKEPVEYGEDERGCDKYHQQKDDAL